MRWIWRASLSDLEESADHRLAEKRPEYAAHTYTEDPCWRHCQNRET